MPIKCGPWIQKGRLAPCAGLDRRLLASLPAGLAAHHSAEPASTGALVHLGLHPILDFDLRLGEGTGALLAVPLLRAACGVLGRSSGSSATSTRQYLSYLLVFIEP